MGRVLLLLGLLLTASPPRAAAESGLIEATQVQAGGLPGCGVALVLALDISYSVDAEEQALQSRGMAAALLSPDVQAAILGPAGPVAISAFTFGGFWDQHIVSDWTLLDDEAAIERFAQTLAALQPDYQLRPTALGAALRYAADLHRRNPHNCFRRVVDVSGDGVTNEGVWPSYHRESGRLAGLTINGLVIRNENPDPLPHYLDEVIQGPGAFVIDVDDYGDYLRAMREKLLRELTPMLSLETGAPGAARAAGDPRGDGSDG